MLKTTVSIENNDCENEIDLFFEHKYLIPSDLKIIYQNTSMMTGSF